MRRTTKTDIVRASVLGIRILALFGLIGFTLSSAPAQMPGSFTATGNMNLPRRGHTATVLADGRVLIAGGAAQGGATASAEIYDPATGTFTRTGDMTVAREGHGAALLPDGRVLIFGNVFAPTDSAELFDPSSGTFRATGKMVNGLNSFVSPATMTRDGKVVIVGMAEVAMAQIYDPATETFTAGGSGSKNTQPLYAVALADSRFLIVGGGGNQLYDPATGAFTFTGPSIQTRYESAATLLANGKVLLAGGDNGSEFFDSFVEYASAELFDPQTGKFTATGNLPQARYGHIATLTGNGSVLIIGGWEVSGVEFYDPFSGTFSAAEMTSGRIFSTATLLKDGRVLIIGEQGSDRLTGAELYVPAGWPGSTPALGLDRRSLSLSVVTGKSAIQTIAVTNTGGGELQWSVATTAPWLSVTPASGTNAGTVNVTASAAGLTPGTYHGSVMIFAAVANTPLIVPVTLTVAPVPVPVFTPTGQMSDSRYSHTATLLADGRVLIAGGFGSTGLSASAEIYDPAAGTFTRTGNMTTARAGHGARLLPDGRVLIFGGMGGNGNTVPDTAELYDPSSGTFTATGKMVDAGFFSAATLLRDGKVLIVSGDATAQIFDPATSMFTLAGSEQPLNFGQEAVALADGRVLIAGVSGNQLYDPASGAFTSTTGSIPYDATATLLPNGKVLFAGGDDGGDPGNSWPNPFDNTGLFDPQAGTFVASRSLRQARYLHTGTLLGDGSVLIAGGFDSNGKGISSVELYDASTGTFAAGQMTTARSMHTATMLQDGRILMTGGYVATDRRQLSSAELYVPAWWSSSAPGIGVDQSSLSLAAPPGQQATQAVAVTNTGGGDVQWNVISTTPWMSATPASGTNSGTVNITASAAGLPEGTYRANITILGSATNSPRIIPVTFAVAPCSYSVSPRGQAFSAAGGTGTIRISAAGGCQWTISSSLSWVTFGGATTGSGNATVSFQVATNSSAARAGTFSIAGLAFSQTFSVEQQSALNTGLGFAGSIAHIAAAGDWNSTITLVNTGASTADVRLSFFDDNGNPLALPLAFPQDPASGGPLLAATLDRTLAPNATLVIDTAGRKIDPVQAGSVQLFTDGSVSAFNFYRWTFHNQEAMAPLEIRNAGAWEFPFDNTNGMLNGGAIANLTAQALSIPVVIRDDTGAVIGSSSISLAGEGHTAFLLSSLFADTTNKRGSIEFDTPPGGRISVGGLRFTPSGAFTTIPVQGDAAGGSGSFGQIAAGGDWNATITLINTGASAGHARLSFFDDNGSPLALPLAFPQEPSFPPVMSAALDRSLAPNAMLVIDTAGLKTDPAQSGSVQLSTDGNVAALTLYRWNFNDQEAMAPLETRNADAYVLPFDNTNGLTNGGAIANLSAQPVIIPVLIRDDRGALIGSSSISLASEGHTSFVLSALFADTANKRGTVEFVAPAGGGISVTGLRFTTSGAFTMIPVLAK